MREFLENYGLYEEFLLLEDYALNNQEYTDKYEFLGENFEYFCPFENSMRPFELDFPEIIKKTISSSFSYGKSESHSQHIPEEQFIEEKLNYTFWILGKCKSCNNHSIHFLLNVYSNNPISNIRDNYNNISIDKRNSYEFPNTNIYIRKIGCSDEMRIEIDKAVSKHFDRESNNWLFKAKKLLKLGAGIGSFAYFRRIIEKELIQIIEEIKKLPESDKNGIQLLLDEYELNPKTYTIYENLFKYLPNSLKELNDNPIQLMYKQTSEGLHSLSEEECLKRAKNIEILLEFTLRKINEEKSEIKSVKDAIKNLK
jgi:hypothetical protein